MTRRQVCCRNPRKYCIEKRALGRSGQNRVVIHFHFPWRVQSIDHIIIQSYSFGLTAQLSQLFVRPSLTLHCAVSCHALGPPLCHKYLRSRLQPQDTHTSINISQHIYTQFLASACIIQPIFCLCPDLCQLQLQLMTENGNNYNIFGCISYNFSFDFKFLFIYIMYFFIFNVKNEKNILLFICFNFFNNICIDLEID